MSTASLEAVACPPQPRTVTAAVRPRSRQLCDQILSTIDAVLGANAVQVA